MTLNVTLRPEAPQVAATLLRISATESSYATRVYAPTRTLLLYSARTPVVTRGMLVQRTRVTLEIQVEGGLSQYVGVHGEVVYASGTARYPPTRIGRYQPTRIGSSRRVSAAIPYVIGRYCPTRPIGY